MGKDRGGRIKDACSEWVKHVEQQLRIDLEYAAAKQALQCAIAALRLEFDVRGRTQKDSDEASGCE